MRRGGYRSVLLGLGLVLTLCSYLTSAELHRAKSKPAVGSVSGGLPRFPPAAFNDYGDEATFKRPQEPGGQDDHMGQWLGHSSETWLYSMGSAMLVGLSGVFPLIVIPFETGKNLRKGAAAAKLKLLLSFAVGGLLGDVFLHLLPEVWAHVSPNDHGAHLTIGLWVITGIFSFLIIEKAFPDHHDEEEEEEEEEEEMKSPAPFPELEPPSTTTPNGTGAVTRSRKSQHGTQKMSPGNVSTKKAHAKNGYIKNGIVKKNGISEHLTNGHMSNGHMSNGHMSNGHMSNGHMSNGHMSNGHMSNGHVSNGTAKKSMANGGTAVAHQEPKKSHIKTSGWLNLMANVVDNFTHGLAVAGAFCVSNKTGVITTLAVLLHEIPHEVGDFAILLQSGFDRWRAAKAQLLTASGGIIGAIAALTAESAKSAGDRTAWILPFTSGGFIYIAMVTVVPDLLKETNVRNSIKQLLFLLGGIVAVAGVTLLVE